MDNQTKALLLAIIALGLGIVAVVRERRGVSKSRVPTRVLVFGPLAGIIGMLPIVLRLSETVRVVASITSVILSLGVIGALVVQFARSRNQ